MSTSREQHTVTLLTNGDVLVAGGGASGSVALSSALLYDPSTDSWTATGSLNVSRARQTASLLPNGQVLVAGGMNETNDRFTALTSAELYTP
jgi:N-acetylneuraminic acid mutarotase